MKKKRVGNDGAAGGRARARAVVAAADGRTDDWLGRGEVARWIAENRRSAGAVGLAVAEGETWGQKGNVSR